MGRGVANIWPRFTKMYCVYSKKRLQCDEAFNFDFDCYYIY